MKSSRYIRVQVDALIRLDDAVESVPKFDAGEVALAACKAVRDGEHLECDMLPGARVKVSLSTRGREKP